MLGQDPGHHARRRGGSRSCCRSPGSSFPRSRRRRRRGRAHRTPPAARCCRPAPPGRRPARAATEKTEANCEGYVGPGMLLAAHTSIDVGEVGLVDHLVQRRRTTARSCVLRLMLTTCMPCVDGPRDAAVERRGLALQVAAEHPDAVDLGLRRQRPDDRRRRRCRGRRGPRARPRRTGSRPRRRRRARSRPRRPGRPPTGGRRPRRCRRRDLDAGAGRAAPGPVARWPRAAAGRSCAGSLAREGGRPLRQRHRRVVRRTRPTSREASSPSASTRSAIRAAGRRREVAERRRRARRAPAPPRVGRPPRAPRRSRRSPPGRPACAAGRCRAASYNAESRMIGAELGGDQAEHRQVVPGVARRWIGRVEHLDDAGGLAVRRPRPARPGSWWGRSRWTRRRRGRSGCRWRRRRPGSAPPTSPPSPAMPRLTGRPTPTIARRRRRRRRRSAASRRPARPGRTSRPPRRTPRGPARPPRAAPRRGCRARSPRPSASPEPRHQAGVRRARRLVMGQSCQQSGTACHGADCV